MSDSFTTRRFVEFADTDMAGIMHFARFFCFMESVEHEFFRSEGLTVHRHEGAEMEGWARVHASCDYRSPLRYGDTVEVRIQVHSQSRSSCTYELEFHRVTAGGDQSPERFEEVARGTLRTVFIRRSGAEGTLGAAPIPDEVRQRIHPPTLPDGAP